MKERVVEKFTLDGIFYKYYASLCLFTNSYVKNITIAEDIVVDTFIKLWKTVNKLEYESETRSWLYTTSRNKAIDHLRSLKTQQRRTTDIINNQSSAEIPDHLHEMIKAEVIAEIHSLIHSLPAQCSRVFEKIYIEGKNIKETAKELNISVNTVKSHKARGLDLLRHKMHPLLWLLLASL